MSKRGDACLRTLLIHGASSVLIARSHQVPPESWLGGLINRRNKNVAAVALANKNARTLWAMLTRGEEYNPKRYPDAFAG